MCCMSLTKPSGLLLPGQALAGRITAAWACKLLFPQGGRQLEKKHLARGLECSPPGAPRSRQPLRRGRAVHTSTYMGCQHRHVYHQRRPCHVLVGMRQEVLPASAEPAKGRLHSPWSPLLPGVTAGVQPHGHAQPSFVLTACVPGV